MNQKTNYPYPIRLNADLRSRVVATSASVSLSFPETIRQAITFGLPVVEARLKKPVKKK